MKKLFLFAIVVMAVFTSCDDTTDKLGSSLMDDYDKMGFSAEEFNLVTESMKGEAVCARSPYAYLGKMADPEAGTYVTANYMTQFRLQPYYVPFTGIDSLVVLNRDGVYDGRKDTLWYGKMLTDYQRSEKIARVKADSCFLTLYVSSYTGDSLAQMKVVANEMKKPYLSSQDYPISYNPKEKGYIRDEKGSVHAQKTYTVASAGKTSSGASHYITISLNEPYTNKIRADKDSTFNNFGSYLMYQFYNPDAIYHKGFKNPSAFLKYLCPGFYIEHIAGKGAMLSISATTLSVYYRSQYIDKKYPYTAAASFSGTEESVQHSTITENDFLSAVTEDDKARYTYLKSPVAVYTTMTLDVEDIMAGHEGEELNVARVYVPCVNNQVKSDYALSAPANLLMVEKDSLNSFFDQRKLMDNKGSFLATYSSDVNGYTFENISNLIDKLYANWKKSGLSFEEYGKKHPGWNVVALVPVDVETSTVGSATTYTSISHSMSMSSTRLMRGTKENGAVKLNVIYSKREK